MGDRIAIQFIDADGELSAQLYSHWDGLSLLEDAKEFIQGLNKAYADAKNQKIGVSNGPLYRREADNVMFNFVGYMSTKHSLYWTDKPNTDAYKEPIFFAARGLATSTYRLAESAYSGRGYDQGSWLVDTRDGSAKQIEPSSDE